MEIIFLVGRILFAVIFVVSALGHLTATGAMAGYAQSKGVPAAKASVIISGVVLLIGGLLIATGYYGDLGALLLVIFLIPTAFIMHAYWKETDPMAKMNEQVAFNKDISLAGAALIIFYLFAKFGNELGLVLGSPSFFNLG